MQPEFVSRWNMTRLLYMEYRRGLFNRYGLSRRLVMAAFALFWVVFGYAYWSSLRYVAIGSFAISLFCVASAAAGYYGSAFGDYRRLERALGTEPEFMVSFYPRGIENGTKAHKVLFPYERVRDFFSTAHLYVLVLSQAGLAVPRVTEGIVFLKETIQNSMDFETFIREKCVNLEKKL